MSIRDTKEARRLIQAMAPEGEFLAFINEREAQMLRDAGGSGIMTLAGIPSFVEYGDISGATASQDQVDSFSGGDDTSNIVDEVALTRGPTVVTGEDQEDDNARMMQALGIVPGLNITGTNNLVSGPQRLPSAKTLATNLGLFLLGKDRPEVRAVIEAVRGGKRIVDAFAKPDLGLSLSKMEERELANLKTGKEVGLNTPAQNQRLEELEQKKAEEEQK